jgi:hypothetical protein
MRDAPSTLRIVSCVRCGRALMATPELPPPPPSSAVAAGAALASQVLGAAGFCVVVAWAWALHPDARLAVAALLAPFALLVFSGGSALRGSIPALGCCALLDLALAAAAFTHTAQTRDFVRIAATRFAPAHTAHLDAIVSVAGGVAAFAAVACIAAIPHVRRLAAWQETQIARVA